MAVQPIGDAPDLDALRMFHARCLALACDTGAQSDCSGLGVLERELNHLLCMAARVCGAEPLASFVDGEQPSSPSSLDRAVRFIEAHAMEPIGLLEISAAAGLSPRGLQAAFRRHRGTTPLGYLRQVRLAVAHSDLQAACHGGGETVSDIAGRCGFVQLSRFARDYRAQYGELPRRTLADVGS